jgi:hypothetical protein
MNLPDITNYTKDEKEALFAMLAKDPEVQPVFFELIRANSIEMLKLSEFKESIKKICGEYIEDLITRKSLSGVTRRV